MTELEKIEYTKSFIDKLANGINPVDNTPIPETDIMNNVRLVRCMFYVSDILRQVIENGGTATQKRSAAPKKAEFALTPEQSAKFPYSEKPLFISAIVEALNDLKENDDMKKLTVQNYTSWLVNIGALEEYSRSDGKNAKRPTDFGSSLGITSEERVGQYGGYEAVFYDKNAQEFLIDNLDTMLAYNADRKKNTPDKLEHAPT